MENETRLIFVKKTTALNSSLISRQQRMDLKRQSSITAYFTSEIHIWIITY